MRKASLAILAIFGLALLLPGAVSAQSQPQEQKPKPEETQSLAEAARKAREKKKQQAQATKVFTNDNVPKRGGVSVVGATQQPTVEKADKEGKEGEGQPEGCDEQCWRGKFTAARKQLADAEKELDILQRELNLKQTQYYSDPQKTMQEEFERKAINEHRAKIDEKQAEVNRLKQGLQDMEAELRRAGGNPGWARP